jgi:hypothetical protein
MNNQINNYLNFKITQKRNNNYNPNDNNIKYLVLIACHCNSDLKMSAIRRNLTYFNFDSIDILVINTIDLSYNSEISNLCSTYNNTKYIECVNELTYDFGKWIYGLKNIDYNNYDYVIFTNDSFIIHAPINHFLNLTHKYNRQFYGYNDSTQQRYHFQSYLFSLRKDVISIFINNYYLKNNIIKTQEDVIREYELKMTDWFNSKSCFLKIGQISLNKGQNIFFTNDILYKRLKKSTLLPFTKIKRIC